MESRGIAILSYWTSELEGVRCQRHAPAALPPGKTRYPLYRRLGGSQGRSGLARKISPPPGFFLNASLFRPYTSSTLQRYNTICYKTWEPSRSCDSGKTEVSQKPLATQIFRSNACRLLSLGLIEEQGVQKYDPHNLTTQRRYTPRDWSRQRRHFGNSIPEFGETHSSLLGCERRPFSSSIMSRSCFTSFPVCVYKSSRQYLNNIIFTDNILGPLASESPCIIVHCNDVSLIPANAFKQHARTDRTSKHQYIVVLRQIFNFNTSMPFTTQQGCPDQTSVHPSAVNTRSFISSSDINPFIFRVLDVLIFHSIFQDFQKIWYIPKAFVYNHLSKYSSHKSNLVFRHMSCNK
jgi:hypothetical protein